MKKIIFLLLITLLISNSFADEYTIYTGSSITAISNHTVNSTFTIRYDSKNDTYYFFTSNYSKTSWIYLNANQLELVKQNLKKFLEWEKIGKKNKVDAEKQLPNSPIDTKVLWSIGNSSYLSNSIQLKFIFYTTKGNSLLVIETNTATASSNQYAKFKLNTTYLAAPDVQSLQTGISKKAIEDAKAKNDQKNNNKNLFK